ncbi:unnamed protein product [marine sediment metagenome]|uniref:Uncharacterized protein n=1 Tax=marine sediment metagenome TaxID=412755 RepID=X0ZUV1_9ZZZZ
MSTKMERLEERIKDLEDIIKYAIGGIDALSAQWEDEEAKEDVLAIKQTLEQACVDTGTSPYHRLCNQVIDMQCAIIGWRKKLAFNSEDDLIGELDRRITEALKDVPKFPKDLQRREIVE